jgi:hypothetical protein
MNSGNKKSSQTQIHILSRPKTGIQIILKQVSSSHHQICDKPDKPIRSTPTDTPKYPYLIVPTCPSSVPHLPPLLSSLLPICPRNFPVPSLPLHLVARPTVKLCSMCPDPFLSTDPLGPLSRPLRRAKRQGVAAQEQPRANEQRGLLVPVPVPTYRAYLQYLQYLLPAFFLPHCAPMHGPWFALQPWSLRSPRFGPLCPVRLPRWGAREMMASSLSIYAIRNAALPSMAST